MLTMRDSYLHEMGITPWYLRDTKRSAQVSCYVYQLFSGEQYCGLLLADVGQNILEEEKLITAIAKALGTTLQGQRYAAYPDLTDALPLGAVVIFMGEAVAAHYATVMGVRTYAPGLLLQQPILKASVWKALQPSLAIIRGLCG